MAQGTVQIKVKVRNSWKITRSFFKTIWWYLLGLNSLERALKSVEITRNKILKYTEAGTKIHKKLEDMHIKELDFLATALDCTFNVQTTGSSEWNRVFVINST